MTWAGLLVAVLYSPVGSPDLYVSVNYNTKNQGIAFTSAAIQNAPTINSSGGRSSQGITIQSYESGTQTGGGYSVATGSSSSRQMTGSFGGSTTLGTSSKGSGSMGGGGMSGLSMSGKGSGSGTSSQAGGVMSMSSNFSNQSSDNNITKQGAGTFIYTTAGLGATDPGDDPSGSTIPVGDGWIFLLILASGYTVWKKSKV